MGKIRIEDIAAYNFDGEVVCSECVSDEECRNVEESEIITDDEASGDSIYFCDRCKKRVA